MGSETGPTWMGWVRNLGMFVLGASLLVYEAVLHKGELRSVLVFMYGALMAGPVFLESFLARK